MNNSLTEEDLHRVIEKLRKENYSLRQAAKSIAVMVLYAESCGGVSEVIYREFKERVNDLLEV